MDTPVLIRIGQGLISRIDDGAILLHPFEEVIDDVIGALRDLKREERLLSVPMARASRHKEPVHLNPAVLRTSRTDTPCPCKDLPGNEESDKGSEASPGKGEPPRNKIVLVRSKGRIGFMIHIVLDQRHRIGQAEILNCVLEQLIAGPVGSHHIAERFTLRRGPFQMSHVKIHAPGIGEKSPVARRLIMSPVVEIKDAATLDVKEVVSNLVGKPGRGMIGLILIHQESVFGFKSENTVQHLNAPRRIEASSAGDVRDLPA